MSVRRLSISRRSTIIIACFLLVAVAATALITAVAANTAAAGAKPTVSPFIASLPSAKQTYVAPRETRVAAFASAHPELIKGVPVVLPPTPSPALGVQVNVWQNPWNPKQPADYLWRGYLNGDLVTVWSGSVADIRPGGAVVNTQQGYVGVAVGTKLGAGADYHQYLTPTQHGGVKITAVNGTAVSLIAEDGTAYTFNLDTRTFS